MSHLQAPQPATLKQFCWRGQVPDWVGPALEKLYGNPYATLVQFCLERDLVDANTYAAYQDDGLRTLFVFSLRDGVVEVFNEAIRLAAEDIELFAGYIFSSIAEARVVVLRAVHIPRAMWAYPSQQHDYLEDLWIALPPNAEAYTASLSKNNRRNVRRHGKSLRAELGDYQFGVHEKTDINPRDVDAIIHFNHARMAGKNKTSAVDERESRHIKDLVREYGRVGVITIGGQVCAGAIACQVSDNYFLLLMAHDPGYDQFSLGFLCCYLFICDCIERRGAEFHFLWGDYDYKRSFLGQYSSLDKLLLYRSHGARLRHAGLALRATLAAARRRAVGWLKQVQRIEHPAARALLRLCRRLSHA
ncbi:GNAT family N-acetyltransferase [Duganella aceris]|uniref:GNAT family N-acetyltransferase n=1 Tax=Duganella aceris TaxID=2703883 RepID=A0ABX0FIW7_9BURK|nr:GNAT family N-acetyltransferase [Duganella aceris]NGZ84503.1 GNAT family N-acetyltransferase [Duganella aceris]